MIPAWENCIQSCDFRKWQLAFQTAAVCGILLFMLLLFESMDTKTKQLPYSRTINDSVTRRDFLKLSAAALLGYGFRDFPASGYLLQGHAPSFDLGRTVYSIRYYNRPSISSTEIGYYNTDSVVNILEETIGDPGNTKNPLWLRTDDGWIHGAYVQPVKNELNTPLKTIPANGLLVEVSVPYTQSYFDNKGSWKRGYRFYYKSTHWAYQVFSGINDVVWYKLLDDKKGGSFFVDARHLRPIKAEELTPISPGVPGKRIEVDLTRQYVAAYEGDRPVFVSRTATGVVEGTTPKGKYTVERKQPSSHMSAETEGDPFDLPGVPWVSYVFWNGVALHGTYWHNNYGVPQSHGCINLTPEDALWIYRWSEPYAPVEKDYVESDQGTPVTIF